MARLAVRGKFIFEGERKFFARGVSYGPFAPNSRGERFPEQAVALRDLELMRELGANVIRTYYPPPPWLFEGAAQAGLRFLVGIPWASHLAFLDSRELSDEIRNAVRTAISELRPFSEAIFAYNLGNEIRSDIVRWHGPRAINRFVNQLFDQGKQLDPDALFTYSNYPSTEYLDLHFLDFISFNVYLHHEPDFRRYLTHLLAISDERPLMLSETGVDTLREGEENQAALLQWQARAAFEMGLCGVVVFAFTDEWFTGGAPITDWAFGLVNAERARKRSFETVKQVFSGPLPPPLGRWPKVSVIVAAYQAAATLGDCLRSLADMSYPNYETIVVDDGSSDATAGIAEADQRVRLLKLEHRGLAAARNAGIAAADGEIIAFLDADAEADRDWLYHLVESLTRREAAAAGGPNFAPPAGSMLQAALAAAPGLPREVRADDDRLSQLCGCNMAVSRNALTELGGFDLLFRRAGDDVDLSMRLRDRGELLAYAPGATVTHRRRSTIGAYLRQQRGYGAAEGLLFRKYPARTEAGAIYGGAESWFARWFGGERIYYGAFGRGLFQSVYPGHELPPAIQVTLSARWVAIAIVLILGGVLSPVLCALGAGALVLTIASAIAGATLERPHTVRLSPGARAILALLYLLGPLVRSYERDRTRLRFDPVIDPPPVPRPFSRSGRLAFTGAGNEAAPVNRIMETMRRTLLRYGLTVAKTDGFEPYDLELRVPPGLRIAINALREQDKVILRYRFSLAAAPLVGCGVGLLLVLMIAGAPWWLSVIVLAAAGIGTAAIAVRRARLVPAMLTAAAAEAGDEFGLRAEPTRDQR
ncbi:MAG TPA: glycosyltransferase [Candidatus Binataceae bacterium]|nr:glycosyltransferase [Candidatus Binataceae bacterium]